MTGASSPTIDVLAEASSKRTLALAAMVFSIIVGAVGGYRIALDTVREESRSIAKQEALSAVAEHVKNEETKFGKIEVQISGLGNKLEEHTQAINRDIKALSDGVNKDIKALIFEVRK